MLGLLSCESTTNGEVEQNLPDIEEKNNYSIKDDPYFRLDCGVKKPPSNLLGTWKFEKYLSHPFDDTTEISLNERPCSENDVKWFSTNEVVTVNYPNYLRSTSRYGLINDSISYYDIQKASHFNDPYHEYLFNGDTLILISQFTLKKRRLINYSYYVKTSADTNIIKNLKKDKINLDKIEAKFSIVSRVYFSGKKASKHYPCWKPGGLGEFEITIPVPHKLDLTFENRENWDVDGFDWTYEDPDIWYRMKFVDFDGDQLVVQIFVDRSYHNTYQYILYQRNDE